MPRCSRRLPWPTFATRTARAALLTPACHQDVAVAASGAGQGPTACAATTTEPLQLCDAACQPRAYADAASQCAPLGACAAAPAAAGSDAGLAAFLARAAPRMLEALALVPPAPAGCSSWRPSGSRQGQREGATQVRCMR